MYQFMRFELIFVVKRVVLYFYVYAASQGHTQKVFPPRCRYISAHFKEPEMVLIIVK